MTAAAFEKKFVTLPMAKVAYLEAGAPERPPVLFVHGIPTSGYLFRHVLRFLQNDFHGYAPDLMGLGDTDVDPETGRFDMESQAEMLLAFMSALGHERFFLVCHDQGGAAAQLMVARQPKRVAAFVITNCVCYDNWPVPVVALYQRLSRIPGLLAAAGRSGLMQWLESRTPLSALRRGMVDPTRLSDDTIHEYLRPLLAPRSARRFQRFLQAGSPRYSLAAVAGLQAYDRPTQILWAADDHYLSPSWGQRLADDIPGAQPLELIPFCGHFWPEERPADFASRMGAFLAAQPDPRQEASS